MFWAAVVGVITVECIYDISMNLIIHYINDLIVAINQPKPTCHHLSITVSLKSQSSNIFLLFSFENEILSCRFVSFACASILAVLILLTLYDEDVLKVEHMLTLMTSLGVVLGVCRSLIPDEVQIWKKKQNDLFKCNLLFFRTQLSIRKKNFSLFSHKFTISPIHGKIMLIQIMFKLNLDKCFNWNM